MRSPACTLHAGVVAVSCLHFGWFLYLIAPGYAGA